MNEQTDSNEQLTKVIQLVYAGKYANGHRMFIVEGSRITDRYYPWRKRPTSLPLIIGCTYEGVVTEHGVTVGKELGRWSNEDEIAKLRAQWQAHEVEKRKEKHLQEIMQGDKINDAIEVLQEYATHLSWQKRQTFLAIVTEKLMRR